MKKRKYNLNVWPKNNLLQIIANLWTTTLFYSVTLRTIVVISIMTTGEAIQCGFSKKT